MGAFPSTGQYSSYSRYSGNYQQQQQQQQSRYSYPAYQPQQSYHQSQQTFDQPQQTYQQPQLTVQQPQQIFQQQQPQQQRAAGRVESSRAFHDPVFNYMITDLSYFGPEPQVSRPSRSSPPSSYTVKTEKAAWQGKVEGQARTRCHNGVLLPFRARCNKVVECSEGEDEFDCDWHKRSTVETVTTRQQFETVIRENENVLVEFFAPWCPACVTFLPHLETLKNSNTDLPLTVVKVNTDDDPELKELFSVDTFPRVMLWSKRWGETDILNGHRTYNKSQGMNSTNIQLWLKKQLSL